MIIRADLKQASKEQLRGNIGTYFLSNLIVTAVTGIISVFLSLIYFLLGWFTAPSNVLLLIFSLFAITSSVINIAISAFDIGVIRIGLNLYYGKHADVSNVFDGFKFPGKIVWLKIITSFFISCWSFISFGILGLIKTYSYSMAPYILADNPEMTAREALSESKRIMHGYKMDFFILKDLSFIGWNILTAITFGIVGIYVNPYKSLSYVNFYKAVSGERRTSYDYSSKRHCIYCGKELYGDEICTCVTSATGGSEPTRFCIYCGKVLHGREECSCRMPDTTTKQEEGKESSRFCIYCGKELHGSEECGCKHLDKHALIVEDTKPSRFCIRCGKTLYGDEICSCEAKSVSEHIGVSEKKTDSPISAASPATMVSGGLKSTMRGTDKPIDYKELSDREEGKKFLNKAGDLD